MAFRWPDDRMTRSPDSSPFSGFDQLPDFAFHQVAFQGAQVADVKLAIEVIGFVEKGASEEVVAGLLEPFAVNVLGADGDFARAGDGLAEFGNAEAAFILAVPAFGVDDLRIAEN